MATLFFCILFFFNDTATTEIYTLSLHDALPISSTCPGSAAASTGIRISPSHSRRSEEHTSELKSHHDLVCRLLHEKKKKSSTMEPKHAWMATRKILFPKIPLA